MFLQVHAGLKSNVNVVQISTNVFFSQLYPDTWKTWCYVAVILSGHKLLLLISTSVINFKIVGTSVN